MGKGFFKKYAPSSDRLSCSIVLRELLDNAVEHGNRGIETRIVTGSLTYLGEGTFRIIVEDEGEGFDCAGLDVTVPEDPRRVKSRGYVLIHALADRLEFNEKGNRVTAYVSATSPRNGPQASHGDGGDEGSNNASGTHE